MKNTLQRYGLFANRKARNAIFCVKKTYFYLLRSSFRAEEGTFVSWT